MDNIDQNITKYIEMSINNKDNNEEISMISSDDIDTKRIISNDNQEINTNSLDNINTYTILADINSMYKIYLIMIICILITGIIIINS